MPDGAGSRRVVGRGRGSSGPGTLDPVEVDSETPYLLAYTSGTTGRPKGALHVQGGFLLSIAREAAYQADLRPGDRALFLDGHGLDHGAVDRRRRHGLRRDGRLLWRAPRTGRTTGSGSSSSRSRSPCSASLRRSPRADPPRRASTPTSRHSGRWSTTGEPWNSGPVRLARTSTSAGGTHPDRELLRRHRGRRLLPVRDHASAHRSRAPSASLRSARDDGRVRRAGAPSRGEVGELVCKRPWPG